MIERGSVVLQVGLEPPRTLGPGDVFFEPEAETIARWDATEDGVTFVGYSLLSDGQTPELAPVS